MTTHRSPAGKRAPRKQSDATTEQMGAEDESPKTARAPAAQPAAKRKTTARTGRSAR